MNCSQKDHCINYKLRCFECGAMSNIHDIYPKYVSRDDNRDKLVELLVARPELLSDSLPNALRLADYLAEHNVRVED